MWGFLCSLLVLATGTFSIENEILYIRHGIPPAREPEIRTSPQWFRLTQRVDHFNPADNRTWQMRYIQNNAFYEEGGPMFVFIGGEWTISTGWITSGLFFDIAQMHNATLFYTEHRFYGGSYPINNLETDSLKYLSADQALADLTYFIEYQKQNTPGLQNSTVVVAGSSYAGTLATWAKLKYPHIVDIAYCSSGPLHAKADFTEYFDVVEETLRLASPTCPEVIRRAMSEAMEMLETPEGSANFSRIFRSCNPVNGSVEPDRSYFLTSLSSPFANAVQTAQPGDLVSVCERLENHTGSDVEKLANYIVPQGSCIWTYDFFKDYYSGTQIIGTNRLRQWLYQTCTEYGWYQTQAFGNTFTIDLYYQICIDLFGEVFGSSTLYTGIERTNLFYGSIEPEVTRLITCHGTGDPWYKMGLLNDLNENAITILVNGTSHSADLYSIRDSDSDELKQAKIRIMNTISAWIYEIEGEGGSTATIPVTTTTINPGIITTNVPIPTSPPTVGNEDNDNNADNFAISNAPTMAIFLSVLLILLTC
ncbi:putative serine protease K12H4.7 [Agrilus planipennis]|uniref:Serine protease K12H4.7 n=1 Tax=Agrilus planipennis TaxID=224129 RepID=A0A1W4XSB7_AGRPL|nr:putative serine protease K12H4.7 [Agrilus planipennis]